tara:strand:- start:3158 stop:5629 length:2472 start_codon:yes stop_codon:yes gene_type:complete
MEPGRLADEYQTYRRLSQLAELTGFDRRARAARDVYNRRGMAEQAENMASLELGSIDRQFAAANINIRNFLDQNTQEGLEAWGVPSHIARSIDIEKTTPGAEGNPNGVGNSHVLDKMRAGVTDRSRFDKRAHERAQAALEDTRASLAGPDGTDIDKPEFREKLAIDIWDSLNAMSPFSRVGASFDAAKEVGVIKQLGSHFARAIDAERKSTGAVGASSEDIGFREGIQAYAQMASNANIQANWPFVRGIVDGSSELSALLNPEARASTVVAGVARIADRARAISSKLGPLTETQGPHIQNVLIYGLAQQESLGLFAPDVEMSQKYRGLMTKLVSAYAGTSEALAQGDTGNVISSLLRTTDALGESVRGRVGTILGPGASQEDLDTATEAATAITSVTPEQQNRGLARDGMNQIPVALLGAQFDASPANAGRRGDARRIFDAAAAQLEKAAAPKPLSMDEVFAGGREFGAGLTSKDQIASFKKEVGFAKLWKKSVPSRIGEMALTAFNTVSPTNVEAWRKAGSSAVGGVTAAVQALQGETPIETAFERRVHAGTFNAAVSELVTFVEAKDIVHGRFKMSDRDLVERALKLGKYKLDDNGVPTSNGVPADYPGIQELLERSQADRMFKFTADGGEEVEVDLMDSNDNMRLYTGATYSESTANGVTLTQKFANDKVAFAAYDASIKAKETISRLATASGLNSRLGSARQGAPLLQAHFDLGSLLEVAGPPGMGDKVTRLVDRDAQNEAVLLKMARENERDIQKIQRDRGDDAVKELARTAGSLYNDKVSAHRKDPDSMEPTEEMQEAWRHESMKEAKANLAVFNPQ